MTNVTVEFDFKKTTARIKGVTAKAQHIMTQQALKDANFYAKQDSGDIIASSLKKSDFEKGILVWDKPYAKRQYYLDAARKDKNPNARKMWAHEAETRHGKEWEQVLQKVINTDL